MIEFDKYKESPEFKWKNSEITMEQFKFIWYMEYGHRYKIKHVLAKINKF